MPIAIRLPSVMYVLACGVPGGGAVSAGSGLSVRCCGGRVGAAVSLLVRRRTRVDGSGFAAAGGSWPGMGPRRDRLQDRFAIFEESGYGSGVMASVSAILVR
jgi:hypothetical protein